MLSCGLSAVKKVHKQGAEQSCCLVCSGKRKKKEKGFSFGWRTGSSEAQCIFNTLEIKSRLSWFGHSQASYSDYLKLKNTEVETGRQEVWRVQEDKTWGQSLWESMQSGDWLDGHDSNTKERIVGHQNIIRLRGLLLYQTKSAQTHHDSHKNGTYVHMFKFGTELKLLSETRTSKLSLDLHLTFTSYLIELSIIITLQQVVIFDFLSPFVCVDMSKVGNCLNLDTILTLLY